MSSSSKQRRKLINSLNIDFKVFYPEIKEIINNNEKPEELVKRLSFLKAALAKKKYKNNYVIAGDTVVYSRKKIIDKTDKIPQAIVNLQNLTYI